MTTEQPVRRRKTNKTKRSHNNNDKKRSNNDEDDDNTKKIIESPTKNQNSESNENENDNDVDEKTLKQVFFEHPLVVVMPWILIPYLVYRSYFFIQLQRPDLLLPLGIHLRPAVAITDQRQVLIVGSMSSGTVQVSSDLSNLLYLEIGHESSDSTSEFVRDGTVSWIHVLRYLEPPTSLSIETTITAYQNLCKEFMPQMGFHPRMYQPPTQNCSAQVAWDDCWKRECYYIVKKEWGCALTSDNSGGSGSSSNTNNHQCLTPFAKVLHQVRHPVRTVESLVAKFCQGGLTGNVTPAFLRFNTALFPNHSFTNDSCIEAASYFVLQYNYAMLTARENGLIDGMFQVETTTPCEIATMAGFVLDDQVVYRPSAEKVAMICATPVENGDGRPTTTTSPAQQLMTSKKHKINVDLVHLDWEDFYGGKHGSSRADSDNSLEQEVRQLVKTLGYVEEEISA